MVIDGGGSFNVGIFKDGCVNPGATASVAVVASLSTAMVAIATQTGAV